MNMKPFQILLVEDNPADVRLAREALKEGPVENNLNVVPDGMEAVAYLRREGNYAGVSRPELILLDLNLPKKDGREVLAQIKADDDLKRATSWRKPRRERSWGTRSALSSGSSFNWARS